MFSSNLFYARALTGSAAISDPDATRRAYALVSLSHPRLSYAGWTRFLRRATKSKPERAGLVFVEDPRGYPHAVFRYSVMVGPSLAAAQANSRRCLRLADLVVAEIAGTGLLGTIARHGEGLARQLGCDAIMIELPGALLDQCAELAGYDAVTGAILSKSLRPSTHRSTPEASLAELRAS